MWQTAKLLPPERRPPRKASRTCPRTSIAGRPACASRASAVRNASRHKLWGGRDRRWHLCKQESDMSNALCAECLANTPQAGPAAQNQNTMGHSRLSSRYGRPHVPYAYLTAQPVLCFSAKGASRQIADMRNKPEPVRSDDAPRLLTQSGHALFTCSPATTVRKDSCSRRRRWCPRKAS